MDAQSFFFTSLPQLIIAAPRRFAGLRGVLAVSVQGQGKFTVRLGDLDSPVVAGFDKKASAKLWFLGDTFDQFLSGELPAQTTTRQLIKGGDADVIDGFGRFLSETAAVLRLKKPGR